MIKSLVLVFSLVLSSTASAAVEFLVPLPTPVADEVILLSIATKETGNRSQSSPGPLGERTQYQFLRTTWQMYSTVPHARAAANPSEVDRVARAYLAAIRAGLRRRGLPETSYFLAVGWNAGLNWRWIPASTHEYAQCVENLVTATSRQNRLEIQRTIPGSSSEGKIAD